MAASVSSTEEASSELPGRDSLAAARAAGLRYGLDDRPGIRRIRTRDGFRYVDPDGRPLKAPGHLARIRALAIPPAWTDIWICPDEDGHIQAVGRDARGRRQYRYHARWRQLRDETKFHRLLELARVLPTLRRRIHRDLELRGLPREKVLATIVRLLEISLIRVGNEEYARQNHSFGLTTLRNRHVKVRGDLIHFEFRGKSGIKHVVEVTHPRVARIVHRCQHLPGQELFQYVDADGRRHSVGSEDVNAYLRNITRQELTAKDFRTWAGTVWAVRELESCGSWRSSGEARRNVVACMRAVAQKLGNTPAICRKSYVHPAVVAGYISGDLLEHLARPARPRRRHGLDRAEQVLVAVLQAAVTPVSRAA